MPHVLTGKQEAFAQAIVDGKGPSEAYQVAGYSVRAGAKVVSVKAAEVGRVAAVIARIAELRAKVTGAKTLDRVKKRELLAAFVLKDETKKDLTIEQLRAMEIDNRMAGHNEPDKVNVFGLSDLLRQIRSTSRKP